MREAGEEGWGHIAKVFEYWALRAQTYQTMNPEMLGVWKLSKENLQKNQSCD